MRLNQLAKKVGKPYTRVEKYLVKDLKVEGIEGPNSKISEELVEKVIYKFGLADEKSTEAPAKKVLETIEAIPANISREETGIEEADEQLAQPTPAEALKPEVVIEDIKTVVEEPPIEEEATETEEASKEPEAVIEEPLKEEVITTVDTGETTLHIDEEGVIKAPKVELEGVKVMGKIDLPEPKAPEEEETKEEDVPVAEEKPKKPRKPKPSADEIEARRIKRIEEAKKKELEAERKELEEKMAQEKAAKKQHYIENVQKVAQNNPKPKKKKKSKANKEAEENKAFETKHKYDGKENLTTWQKIVKWFNT